MIAVGVRRLDACDLINVFVIFYLSLFIRVVDGIEQSLINRSLIEDNRVLLIETIVYHIGDYNLLTVRGEEVVHYCSDHGRGYVLLNDHAFIHSIGEVIHCPSTGLLGLIGEHSDTLGLRVVAEGTQQCN